MNRKMMSIVFAALITVSGALAQGRTLELSLSQALEIALSDNPTIKVANLEIERYKYVKREVVGNHLPQVSVNSQYSYSAVKQTMSKNNGISLGADNIINTAASISVPLFVPAVYSTLKMTATQREMAVESARSSRLSLINETKKAYYNVLLAEQLLRVLMGSEQTIRQTVDDTRSKYEAGLASEYDLLTAEVQLSNLQPTIIQTRESIELSKLMLKMYLSVPEDVNIMVTGSLDDFKAEVLAQDGGLSTDVSQNSDIRTLDLQKELLRRQLKLSRTSRMPTLAAFGNISWYLSDVNLNFGSMMGGGAMGGGASGGGESTEMYSPGYTRAAAGSTKTTGPLWGQWPMTFGAQLSIPIFAGLTNVNKDKQLKNSIAQLDLQRDYAYEGMKVQVSSAVSSLLTAREKMKANEKTMEQARKAYTITRTRYEAGSGTILELNSAELSLTQASLNYSQAIYDYLSAKADYDKITGTETIE